MSRKRVCQVNNMKQIYLLKDLGITNMLIFIVTLQGTNRVCSVFQTYHTETFFLPLSYFSKLISVNRLEGCK